MTEAKTDAHPPRLGFALFAFGTIMGIGGLLLAGVGLARGATGALIIALLAVGELLTLGAILLLGGDGYTTLQARTSTMLRREGVVAPRGVRLRRHRFGVALLVLHVFLYLAAWSLAVLAYTKAAQEPGDPSLFGLSLAQQAAASVWLIFGAELLFIVAIALLGSEWWKRFEKLFTYQKTPAVTAAAPKQAAGLGYRIGLGVFVVGNALSVAGLIVPALDVGMDNKAGLAALLITGGEIVCLSSILFLGKAGFSELKSRLFSVFRRVPSGQPISVRRHRVGVSFLALHVVVQASAILFPLNAYTKFSRGEPTADLFGMTHEVQLTWFVGLLIAAQLLFFAGIYTLGADWWERFRNLFRWSASVSP